MLHAPEKQLARVLLAALAVLLISSAAQGASFIVPSDASMIHSADAIVVARVVDSTGEYATSGRQILTASKLQIEEVLKGTVDPNAPLVVRDAGGVMPTEIMGVSDGTDYRAGDHILLFLQQHKGDWRTYGATLGGFYFVTDTEQRPIVVRGTHPDDITGWDPNGHPHEELPRLSAEFLQYITAVVEGRADAGAPPYFVTKPAPPVTPLRPGDQSLIVTSAAHLLLHPVPNAPYPAASYSNLYRWTVFDDGGSVSFRTSGTQPGLDGPGAAARAVAAWNNDPGSKVNYVIAGTSSAGFTGDGQNTVVFNDSADVPAGAAGYSQFWGDIQYQFDGGTFNRTTEADIVLTSNFTFGQKTFDEVVTHEFGHTLGLRHSDQGTPSTTQAVMNSISYGNFGAVLQAWDIEAIDAMYPVGAGGGSAPGTPSGVTATATGTTTVRVQWTAVTGASTYEVQRATVINGWTSLGTTAGTTYNDSGLTPNKTYLYRVRALNSGGTGSAYSAFDLATTIIFTDDPLVVRVTVIKAVHLTELRTAVNAVRVAAGLATKAWTDPSPSGVKVKAVHITELRSALAEAYTALGKGSPGYTYSVGVGSIVHAADFQEIRNYVK
jgi:hypothetical protein